jgi:hypothetical protein
MLTVEPEVAEKMLPNGWEIVEISANAPDDDSDGLTMH